MSRFHSRHFSEGERAQTGCHSFTGPVITAKLVNHPHLLIGPFVSNTRWVWANERVQWDATWAGGQRRVLPWGRLRFNGRDYSILPSACLLHLVLFAWFKWTGKKKEKELKGSPAKASCAIYICVIVMCQQHPSLPYAVNTCPCSGVSSTTVASRRRQFKGVPCCFLLQPPQCSFAVPLLVCFFAWDSGRLEQTKWKAPVIFFKTFHLLRFSLRSSVTCLFS